MNILDKFKTITGYDIQSYFQEFSDFILSDYQKIVSYCQDSTTLSADVITTIKDLVSRMKQINDLFSVYLDRLSGDTAEIWEVLDNFEATKVTLLTVVNSPRWLRSTKNIFRNNLVNNDFILRQGQNFEMLATEIGYSDPGNEWAQIAIDNGVIEEDYTFEGGNKLKISFVNNYNYFVNCVIDSINGEKLYGLDIDRNLVFEDNDIKTLSYRETIIQQTSILIGLIKGSVPEFPLDGIDKGLIGSNVNAIQYPSILRQQSAVFEKDDRYKSIEINQFNVKGESVSMDIQVTTRLGEVLNEQLTLA